MNASAHVRSSMRIWLVLVWPIMAVLLIAWLATLVFRGGGDPHATLAAPVTDALITRGAYLARVGDCVACHSAPGGKPFAGGLPIQAPVGVIYSSNITPDLDTGIGHYTYGQFERVVRRGIAPSGETLYPAMPYPSYAKISDEDMQALYAYFMHGVTPVHQANRRNGIPWPLSMRWPLAYWRWMFAPHIGEHVSAPGIDELARGAYLVEGLGHCGACHTPRGPAFEEKALDAKDGNTYLSGSTIDHWVAPSLRNDRVHGIGAMSAAQLVALLKTGRNDTTAIFGGMSDVVHQSTQYMSDADLHAVAAYLQSLPAPSVSARRYDPTVAEMLHQGNVSQPGAQLFLDNCAACHRSHGRGYQQTFPALALNPVVNNDDPTSLIHLVLDGGVMPGTQAAPTEFAMPAFNDRLSNEDIAQVLTFIRSSWGNQAPPVMAQQVAHVRRAVPKTSSPMTDYDPRR